MKLEKNSSNGFRFIISVVLTLLLLCPALSKANPVRGQSGDLAADIILGEPNFGEIVPNQTDQKRVFNPGGVFVDRSHTPNRIYVYDAGNSRILGFTQLGTSSGGVSNGLPCECGSDAPGGSCVPTPGTLASIFLGQPGFNTSAANGDGNFQNYPNPPTPSAGSLAGMADFQVSTSEGGSFMTMATDSFGNLYVPDYINNRVLRYDWPVTAGTQASHVWGQPNLNSGNANGGSSGVQPNGFSFVGTDSFGAGVAIDGQNNLWVADPVNNRVLRFPFSSSLGAPVTNPNLVLGQTDFISNVAASSASDLAHLRVPTSVRVDSNGTVYVSDIPLNPAPTPGNDCFRYLGRVLVFNNPSSNGVTANSAIRNQFISNPEGLELDPTTPGGVWVNDFCTGQAMLFVNGNIQKVILKDEPTSVTGCIGLTINNAKFFQYADGSSINSYQMCAVRGGLGVDRDGNVFLAGSGPWQDVWRFPAPIPTPAPNMAANADFRLFPARQFNVFNDVSKADMDMVKGVAVYGTQLIVADGWRISFYNNPTSAANDQQPDGFVGNSDPTLVSSNNYGRIREDKSGHLWVINGSTVEQFQLPLANGSNAAMTLNSPLPLAGGGSFSWGDLSIGGVAPDSTSAHLWVADPNNNRVFRIRNPLTSPVVDVVLGQTSPTGNLCNQGSGPNSNTLCNPGSVELDGQGNIYVADHGLEDAGNGRMLEFDSSLFPSAPSNVLYAVPATRVLGTGGSFTAGCTGSTFCGPMDPAFSAGGTLVVGMDGYRGSRFPLVMENPIQGEKILGNLQDFGSMPYALDFDSQDNLYVGDLNRGRVLIYKQPFGAPSTGTVTPTSTPTPSPTPIQGVACIGSLSTPLLNLQVGCYQRDNQQERLHVRITNWNTTPVTLGNLSIKMWMNESKLCNMQQWIQVGQVCQANGSGCVNVVNTGFTATVSPLSTPCTVDSTHIANQVIVFTPAGSTQVIPPNGGYWDGGLDLGIGRNNPQMDDNWADDYSKTAVCNQSLTDDSHFGLYFNGTLLREWLNPTALDPNTGAEPCCGNPHGGMSPLAASQDVEGSIAVPATPTVSPTPSRGGSPLVAPVPNVSHNGEPIHFQVTLSAAAQVRLGLFALTGEQVYQATVQGNQGMNDLVWNLENQTHGQVASGLYLYVLQVDGADGTQSKTGRVAVLH